MNFAVWSLPPGANPDRALFTFHSQCLSSVCRGESGCPRRKAEEISVSFPSRAAAFTLLFAMGSLPGLAVEPLGCARPAVGSVVAEPSTLRSEKGVLRAELAFVNWRAADGQEQYCYRAGDGSQAPTLRVRPGDLLILRLRNELRPEPGQAAKGSLHSSLHRAMPVVDAPCASAPVG